MTLNPESFSYAQIVVCFVGIIFIQAVIQKAAGAFCQRFFPKTEKYVTLAEFRSLKDELVEMRGILLVIAVKTGVDVNQFKALAGGK